MFNYKIPTVSFKIVLLLMCLSIAGIAQSIDPVKPPSTVQTTFSEKFPGVGKIKWERYPEEKKEFQAYFTFEDIPMKAFFDKYGNWIETEREINTKEIPDRVMQSIRTQYPNDKIVRAYEIVKDQKITLYEVVVKTDSEKTSLVISTDGYFTSR